MNHSGLEEQELSQLWKDVTAALEVSNFNLNLMKFVKQVHQTDLISRILATIPSSHRRHNPCTSRGSARRWRRTARRGTRRTARWRPRSPAWPCRTAGSSATRSRWSNNIMGRVSLSRYLWCIAGSAIRPQNGHKILNGLYGLTMSQLPSNLTGVSTLLSYYNPNRYWGI